MTKLFGILALVFASTKVSAQDMMRFPTMQACNSFEYWATQARAYEEELLFEGISIVNDPDGQAYQGVMVFTVNQQTGTWAMFSLYPDGTACLIASGYDFQPFSH